MDDTTVWQSRAVLVLVDQLGYSRDCAKYVVDRYARGIPLNTEDASAMGKVLGIIGAMMGSYMALRHVNNNTAIVIEAQGRAMRAMTRAAMGYNPTGCGKKYPLLDMDKEGCYLNWDHDGLHVLKNGFAFDQEDIEWATTQMSLIRSCAPEGEVA